MLAHFRRFGALVEPGALMEVEELVAEGETVVCLSRGRMRGARMGLPYNNRYAFVFRFREGHIAGVTEYLDTALVETALLGKRLQ